MCGKFKFAIAFGFALVLGCQTPAKRAAVEEIASVPLGDHLYQNLTPEYPDTQVPVSDQQFDAGPLKNFSFDNPDNFFRLSLEYCIEHALRNSQVVRELGGTILRSPELSRTDVDPALTYTNPVIGEEAALSEFDATFNNQFLYQSNDRAFNSSFIGDQGILKQKVATNLTSLSKRSATGTQFRLAHELLYDRNNTPANRFSNDISYDTFLAAEFRQPLLQGRGVQFNRIAGPNNLPGVNTGVLIARANTDITLADFELGVRNLVSDVENAYWDLYFAYRDLEAKIEARNGAYRIWEDLKAREQDTRAADIYQAEEQYYLFASRVEDAIFGLLNDGTRTFNGSSSGTFRGNPGVRTAERRLRLLAGYPLNDGLLMVPADTPIEANIVFDWNQVKSEALIQRTELRRQRWVMKREQLNYLANKNYLLPRLDFVGKYRVRGFGNDLFGDDGFDPSVPPGADLQDGSAAYATLRNGDLQEWELGMDLSIPIGFRRQMAAVRNSELKFLREKKILWEQEREIIYGLSNALGELDRTSSLLEVNAWRLDASKRQFRAIQEEFQQDNTTIDLVLESQRRVIDAKVAFFRSQVEFMLAVKSVQFEKGTELQYHNITLSEQGWCSSDSQQAVQREKYKSRPLNYYIPGLKVSSPLNQPSLSFATEPVYSVATADPASNESAPPAPAEGGLSDPRPLAAMSALEQTGSDTFLAADDDVVTGDLPAGSFLTQLARQLRAEDNQSEPSK